MVIFSKPTCDGRNYFDRILKIQPPNYCFTNETTQSLYIKRQGPLDRKLFSILMMIANTYLFVILCQVAVG